MNTELKSYLDAMEARVFADYATTEDLERIETLLASESQRRASPQDRRAASHALALFVMDLDKKASCRFHH
jgi:hypothetical protein